MAAPEVSSILRGNLVPSGTVTSSNQPSNLLTDPVKAGLGSARMFAKYATGGSYKGPTKSYFVEIDSVSAGTEIGQATFRWSNDDGETFQGTGILTSTTPLTLENAIQVYFQPGPGGDFGLGDWWRFRAVELWPVSVLGSYDSLRWRSGSGSAVNLDIDLGSAQSPTVFGVLMHNMPEGTVLVLSSYSDAWVTQVDSWNVTLGGDANGVEWITPSQAARYWRVALPAVSPTLSFHEIGILYLGTYTQLPFEFADDYQLVDVATAQRVEGSTGQVHVMQQGRRRDLTIHVPIRTQAEHDALRAVYEGMIANNEEGIILWDRDYAQVRLYGWTNGFELKRRRDMAGRWGLELEMRLEAIR